MTEGEDYNEFNCWDSGGAAVMLAIVPVVMYFVFSGHDYKGTVCMGLGAGVVGLFVFLVARYVNSRMVSRLMQLAGTALCIIYWVYALHLLNTWDRFSAAAPEQETEQPAS